MIPVLVGVSIVVFVLARVLPGDVFQSAAGTSGLSEEARQELRREAGLDRPLVVQYLDWGADVLRLDFGTSLFNRQSVNSELKRTIPVTVELTILATAIGLLIAIPLGLVSAVWQGTPLDYLARLFGVLGLSVPNYVLGTVTITYLALWFHWTPAAGGVSVFKEPVENLKQFIIPSLILGSSFAASVMRMTRSTVLGVMREDYVRTAMAKGIRERAIVLRHVLRNALLPVITLAGAQVGYLLGGTVIVESIFSLTGVGSLAYGAVLNRDYIVLQAVTLLAAFVFVFINLGVDLSYAWLDPRVRLS